MLGNGSRVPNMLRLCICYHGEKCELGYHVNFQHIQKNIPYNCLNATKFSDFVVLAPPSFFFVFL